MTLKAISIRYSLVISIAICLRIHVALSDFIYADFNRTTGLVFNGAAKPTDCNDEEYSSADTNSDVYQHGQTATMDVYSTVKTVDQYNTSSDTIHDGVFGHRRDITIDGSLLNRCNNTRLRLTPSHPSKAGSVWYESRVPVLNGFETTFSWQITNHSVECTELVDKSFSRNLHRSCAVNGGDGFAFVIHSDSMGSSALGGDGEQLGYGGIANSIAIEFDTWTNVDNQKQSDDVFQDHISIHSGGPLLPNSSNKTTSLGYWRPYSIADGKVHTTKIQYLPYVETRYYELMTANDNLIPYLKDNGEGRKIGTLAVFVDQGITEDRPLFAIPVNLSLLLNLPDSLVFVGFTASTGRKWQMTDITRWEWCDSCHGMV